MQHTLDGYRWEAYMHGNLMGRLEKIYRVLTHRQCGWCVVLKTSDWLAILFLKLQKVV